MSQSEPENIEIVQKWAKQKIDAAVARFTEQYRVAGRFIEPDDGGKTWFGLGDFLGDCNMDVRAWHLFAAGYDNLDIRDVAQDIAYTADGCCSFCDCDDPEFLDEVLERYIRVLAALRIAVGLDVYGLPGKQFIRESQVIDFSVMRQVRSIARVIQLDVDAVLEEAHG